MDGVSAHSSSVRDDGPGADGSLTAQIRAEFQREGDDVGQTLSRMAVRDSVQQLAFSLTHGGDASQYLQEASSLAQEYQLDFLEIVQADGTIVSSAQWPARFGYKRALPPTGQSEAFLKNEEIPDGSALGMIAIRPVHTSDGSIYLIGGKKVDRSLIESLSLPPGMYVWLYRTTATGTNDIIGQSIAEPNRFSISRNPRRAGRRNLASFRSPRKPTTAPPRRRFP